MITPGVAASDVVRFIDQQHRAAGAEGESFCIVSFGEATSLPHGADGEQILRAGDVILVDTGCRIDGYHSDRRGPICSTAAMAHSNVHGQSSARDSRPFSMQQNLVRPVKASMLQPATCSARHGLGPDYSLPGLPHRAGHGLGLEIHEAPYIVRGNQTPWHLACASERADGRLPRRIRCSPRRPHLHGRRRPALVHSAGEIPARFKSRFARVPQQATDATGPS